MSLLESIGLFYKCTTNLVQSVERFFIDHQFTRFDIELIGVLIGQGWKRKRREVVVREIIAYEIKGRLTHVATVILGANQNIPSVENIQAFAFPVHALVLGIGDELGQFFLFIFIALLHAVFGAKGVHVELVKVLGEQRSAQQ